MAACSVTRAVSPAPTDLADARADQCTGWSTCARMDRVRRDAASMTRAGRRSATIASIPGRESGRDDRAGLRRLEPPGPLVHQRAGVADRRELHLAVAIDEPRGREDVDLRALRDVAVV